MWFLLLLSPLTIFSQQKITIPRYSVVYTVIDPININDTKEIYFDHKEERYFTNDLSQTTSVKTWYNKTTITISKYVIHTYLPQKNTDCTRPISNTIPTVAINSNFTNILPKTSDPYDNYDPSKGNYRRYALSRTYIVNDFYPLKSTNENIIPGLWYDHFTGTYFTDARCLEIDHIVPYEETKNARPDQWTTNGLRNYYYSINDAVLLPVYYRENSKKRELAPSKYLPPNEKFHEIYIGMWVYIKKIYNMQ